MMLGYTTLLLLTFGVAIFVITQTDSVRIFQTENGRAKGDPEIYMSATELITSKGYPCENHWVTTEDGYILNLIRIPHGLSKNSPTSKDIRPAILLQHGFVASATNFLSNLANESLAYILADAGADVWMGNNRGNNYSMNHTTLSPKELKFWEFSWDEMGKYDLPANINYIRNVTGQDKIFYCGHSQGTTQAFAGFSENQELASHIRHFIALSPVARLRHSESPIVKIAPLANDINIFLDFFNHGALVVPEIALDYLADDTCTDHSLLCENLLFLLCGPDYSSLNKSRIPVYISHTPSGTSSRDLLQWAQQVNSGEFQKFDYGSEAENMKHYGQKTPPRYDPSKMKVPVAIFSGTRDWLGDPKDLAWLLPQINVTQHVNIDFYNHMDSIWAVNAAQLLYKHIVNIVMS